MEMKTVMWVAQDPSENPQPTYPDDKLITRNSPQKKQDMPESELDGKQVCEFPNLLTSIPRILWAFP